MKIRRAIAALGGLILAFAAVADAGEVAAGSADTADDGKPWYDSVGRLNGEVVFAEITRVPHVLITATPFEFAEPIVARTVAEWFRGQTEVLRRETKDFFDDDYAAEISKSPDPPEDGVYMTVNVTVAAARPTATVATVVFDAFSVVRSAAHPSSLVEAVNIDLATGRRLALADLFDKPDAALGIFAALSPALVGRWMRDTLGGNMPPDFDAEKDEGVKDGTAARPENYEGNIAVEKDGLRIHFQEYQLFPRLFGRPTITIPLSELSPAAPKAAVWP